MHLLVDRFEEVLWRADKQMQAIVRFRQSYWGLWTNQAQSHPPRPMAAGLLTELCRRRQGTGSLGTLRNSQRMPTPSGACPCSSEGASHFSLNEPQTSFPAFPRRSQFVSPPA